MVDNSETAIARRPSSPRDRDGMADYTHREMHGILKPFAERTLAIEHCVGELQARMDGGDAKFHTHEQRLTDSGSWSQQIKGEIAAMKAHQVAAQNNIGQLDKARVELESIATESQAERVQMRETIKGNADSNAQLRQALDETILRVDQLFSALEAERSKIDNHIEQITIRELPSLQTTVENHSLELQQAQNQLQTHTAQISEQTKTYTETKRDNDKALTELHSEISYMKTQVTEMESTSKKMQDQVTENTATVKSAQHDLNDLTGARYTIQDNLDKLTNQVLNLQVRFVPLEKHVGTLLDAAQRPMKATKSTAENKDNKDGKDSKVKKEETQKPGGRNIGDYIADIEELVNLNNKRLDDMQSGDTSLEARMQKELQGINQKMQDLQANVGTTDTQVKDVENRQAETEKKIEDSMNLHNEMKADLDAKSQRIDEVHGEVQGLTKQSTEQKEALSKVSMSLGLCNDKMSGLRKGLRDMGGRVSGTTDPLLPETTKLRPFTPTLPEMRGLKSPTLGLSQTPRTTRPHSVMGTTNSTTTPNQAWASPAFAGSGMAS